MSDISVGSAHITRVITDVIRRIQSNPVSGFPVGGAASATVRHEIMHKKSWGTFFMELGLTLVPAALLYFTFKHMRTMLNPDAGKNDENARRQKQRLLKKLAASGRRFDSFNTDQYEDTIFNDIVLPDDINVTLDDIGGMEELKAEIHETVIVPLQSPHLFASFQKGSDGGAHSLLQPPRGVLFYGPPGTGKTMMAKAIAHTCQATFIDVKLSSLENKYYGETQKLIRALFSLAVKLAPTVIFIDEIDLFFPKRTSDSHRPPVSLHGEFMTLWDGLTTNQQAHVMILGATNRPFDLDEAILRRLPRNFLFDLPDRNQRIGIMKLLLSRALLDVDVSIERLSESTEKYSGSDLKEMCKFAAMIPVRELIKKHAEKQRLQKLKASKHKKFVDLDTTGEDTNDDDENDEEEEEEEEDDHNKLSESPRAIAWKDFQAALKAIQATGHSSYEYQKQFKQHVLGGDKSSKLSSSSSIFSSPSSSSSSASASVFGGMNGGGGGDQEIWRAIGDMSGRAKGESMQMVATVMANYHLWPQFTSYLNKLKQRQQQLERNQASNSNSNQSPASSDEYIPISPPDSPTGAQDGIHVD